MGLRITFLVPNVDLSGGTRIILTYAQGLALRGHELTIVSGSRPGLFTTAVSRLMRRDGSGVSSLSPKIRLTFTDNQGPAIVGDLPAADVLIATWWETVEAVSDAPAVKGVKVHLVQDHEVFPYLPIARAASVHRLPFHKITVSHWLFGLMQSEYGATDTVLIPNPIDLREFPWRRRSMSSVPTVGTLFSTAPRKNSARALEVVNIARRSMPALRLIGYGAAAPPRSSRKISFTKFDVRPSRNRIAEIYGSADFWLFTSDTEGFGLPILESMAVGTPVVATRAGAAPELVSDATGVLVPHNSDEAARALLRLYSYGPSAWLKMSEECRAVAEANDLPGAISKFEESLCKLVASEP